MKKITEAKDAGDQMEVQQAQQNFAQFGKRTGVTPFKCEFIVIRTFKLHALSFVIAMYGL